MGRVAAPYAVRGWVKIQPYTEYLDNLLDYPVWRLGKAGRWREYAVLEAKVHGQFLLAQLEGVNDRDAAETLHGHEVAVMRAELPPAETDEYYWDDLVGLEVVNLAGDVLGRVAEMLESGAHDIMRVVAGERERLIPFVAPIVRQVDIAAGRIEVDWGTDW